MTPLLFSAWATIAESTSFTRAVILSLIHIWVLEIVELTDSRRRKVQQYSLGMRQRLGIAQALLGNPKLLILDEPTNGLDPSGIQQMRSLIKDMPNRCGATVLISSHLLGEMEQMVDQVGIINHGRLLFQGELDDLRKHSQCDISLRVLHPEKAAPCLLYTSTRSQIWVRNAIFATTQNFAAYSANGRTGAVMMRSQLCPRCSSRHR